MAGVHPRGGIHRETRARFIDLVCGHISSTLCNTENPRNDAGYTDNEDSPGSAASPNFARATIYSVAASNPGGSAAGLYYGIISLNYFRNTSHASLESCKGFRNIRFSALIESFLPLL